MARRQRLFCTTSHHCCGRGKALFWQKGFLPAEMQHREPSHIVYGQGAFSLNNIFSHIFCY